MDKVKKHFEEEAEEFDQIILRLIPFYAEMIDALVLAIPFEKIRPIKVIDMGCGTGTIAKKIKEKFPNSKITCLDLAENMIEMAKIKMQEYDDISYIVNDFCNFKFDGECDVIISSLALHHLVADKDKKSFYRKAFDNLSDGGVFYNADVVLGSNAYLETINMLKWKEFMSKNVSLEEIENKWIPKYYEEDRPARLIDQIKWLEEIGFVAVDVIWKYYKGAVYGGSKK
ncbi:methyltransferase type 12 [candidate division WOR-1 bacterium RIFOXYC2_FULL_37_10]|uniref:Methyltransferase type 12 n=1 Tax=candidate division WOR-1 bacterium RIFOXYB2_FULL_37_13 TaxID=1802579 RepID=A0A1F4SDX2_UNCSA|nr:MAG: methyltransferase type 12 [candidate division WOR-1 bacterium RIFOXYB2_FULL_37_13]OGC36838.1 MAG: methyltransferase type 12 [candidate division WOR-1 bacterium RIFOXYC2_FULL_37_10]